MKEQYIKELADGSYVDSVFILSSKELRSSRNGVSYLSMELSDRTGRMPAVWFQPTSGGSRLPAGSAASVRGRVTTYRGLRRVSVEAMAPASDFEAADMMPDGVDDKASIIQEFKQMAASVRDPSLRRILGAVFGDRVFFARFCECPGAQTHHHAFLGGLVRHSVAVARICRTLATEYPSVDSDLLVTAALLHDIGKVDELSWASSIEYTDQGRLLGHVVLGDRRMHASVGSLRKPVNGALLTRLSHAMLSHHGELEWGAPRRPSTIEALLLHHADNLDAKASGFVQLVSGASAAQERWTDSYNLFRRPLFAPASVEDDRPLTIDEDQQYLKTSA